jgi:hypothetical protein
MTNFLSDEPHAVWDEYDWERFLRGQEFLLSVEADRTAKSTLGMGESAERKFTIREVNQEEAKEAFKYAREAVDVCALHRKADDLYYQMREVYGESVRSYRENSPLDELPCELTFLIMINRLRHNLGAVPLAPPKEAIGLAIAYLKRALEAVLSATELLLRLESTGTMETSDLVRVRKRLFYFKARIVNHMGDLRKERRQRL